METMFDLQMFAEEATEETTEVMADTPTEDAPEEPAEEIPEELDGVSEDVAREVMQQAEETDKPEEMSADQDSDNKPVDVKTGKVPYQRFKQQIDKVNDLESQLAAYRQKFGDINSNPQQTQPTPPPAPQPQPVQQPQQVPHPQIQFSPEISKQIQSAITQRAMQLTNMTQGDVDSLEYAEDDDQRLAAWKSALKFAESDVYAGIRQAQAQRAQAVQKMLQEHEAVVKTFNDYTAQQQAQPDFEKIQNYAIDTENGFAAKLTEIERNVIDSAYQRVLRNTASAQDVYTIRNYFEQAKADYYNNKGGKPAKATTFQTTQRAHPRSEQIRGAASPDGSVSVEQLKDMLVTKDWKDIPEKYRNIMKGL